MAFSYNIKEVPPADEPCVDHDIRRAKQFLKKYSQKSGDNLYDHLTEVLNKILAERPRDAVDMFEEYSRKVKEERFKIKTDHLRDVYVPPAEYEEAKKLMELFKIANSSEDMDQERRENDDEDDDDTKKKKPNILELLFYFEQTGVGLPRSEMVLLNLSIRRLMADKPIENVRFWGKVLGNPKNYYIVEAELEAEEIGRRLEKEEAREQSRREEEEAEAEIEITAIEAEPAIPEEQVSKVETNQEPEKHLELVFPPMPKNLWKPLPEVPAERLGNGVNKKIYFICNSPGLDDWMELPLVTPQQIVAARQIVRCFTGNLDSPIYTFPPFSGTEKNYLRAQIARISATTLVSPIGYFTFGGDEEEEIGEEEEPNDISENLHYDHLPLKELIDPSMSNWCHHSQYILKQGRITWWNPAKEEEVQKGGEEEEEEEEQEEEEERGDAIEKEIGPPLLTPLSEDALLDSIPAWTVRQSSLTQPDTAVAIVRSNIWLGSVTFATDKKFANIYIGWGCKTTAYNYSPPAMPPIQDQYKIGPEIMEIQDPTFQEEENWRVAHLPKTLSLGGKEELQGEEDLEEDEEEEDEEDDE